VGELLEGTRGGFRMRVEYVDELPTLRNVTFLCTFSCATTRWGRHLSLERIVMKTLLLLHYFSGGQVHLTLQFLQLLAKAVCCYSVMFSYRLVEPRDG
jgi:hypothetical protein